MKDHKDEEIRGRGRGQKDEVSGGLGIKRIRDQEKEG